MFDDFDINTYMKSLDNFQPCKPDFIARRDMSELKRDAKRHSRELNIKHHQALEIVAIENDFDNWHQLTVRHKSDVEVEDFIANGIILVFNEKDAPEESEDGLLTQDYRLSFGCDRAFVHAYIHRHHLFGDYSYPEPSWSDESSGNLKEAINAGDAMNHSVWFRVNQDLAIDDKPMDVLRRIYEYTFFPPDYISLRGIFRECRDERGQFSW